MTGVKGNQINRDFYIAKLYQLKRRKPDTAASEIMKKLLRDIGMGEKAFETWESGKDSGVRFAKVNNLSTCVKYGPVKQEITVGAWGPTEEKAAEELFWSLLYPGHRALSFEARYPDFAEFLVIRDSAGNKREIRFVDEGPTRDPGCVLKDYKHLFPVLVHG